MARDDAMYMNKQWKVPERDGMMQNNKERSGTMWKVGRQWKWDDKGKMRGTRGEHVTETVLNRNTIVLHYFPCLSPLAMMPYMPILVRYPD